MIKYLAPDTGPQFKLAGNVVYQKRLARRVPGEPDVYVYTPARGALASEVRELKRLSQDGEGRGMVW